MEVQGTESRAPQKIWIWNHFHQKWGHEEQKFPNSVVLRIDRLVQMELVVNG